MNIRNQSDLIYIIFNFERQKVGVENLLYNRKLQERPGKSLNTAAIGPTNSAAGAEETPPDRNNVRAGGTKRPGSCSPLGQSAAKLPKQEFFCREERSTTIIDWGLINANIH